MFLLARRFHIYTGLDELSVDVLPSEQPREPALDVPDRSTHHEGAAAYFIGIVDDVCRYRCDVNQRDDGLAVTATMAHEVAHAFRTRFGLALAGEDQRDEEERRTDLTTIYLGAGVLTTNAAARHRSRTLRERLGIPSDPASWPEPWSLDELTAPFDDGDDEAIADTTDDDAAADDDDYPWNSSVSVECIGPGEQIGDLLTGALGVVSAERLGLGAPESLSGDARLLQLLGRVELDLGGGQPRQR